VKLLLRQGIVYYGGAAWTAKHEQWLRSHRFDIPGLALAYDAAFDAMLACVDRRDRLDDAITAMAADSAFTPVVTRLGCLRGVSTLTAFGLATEIGDWDRLTGRSIGAYLGMVPTETSSGATRSQGGVTKTGNSHARRLLVEAAWHHRPPYRPGQRLRQRWDQASPAARARGQAANRRGRPRTRRLVLVIGRPRPLTPNVRMTPLSGRGKRLGVTRVLTMSNHVVTQLITLDL
jgi:transposase